ncbi:Thiol:disulfide interchange protein TlpA [Croceibacterium atlanticum]|uniref:Thiol:disulfide interchange protein TlpA n=1 Tax=Croceibacterium atlanticum TaxID=1267766 RepID=A0A0F7KU75_9SPHN|nr:TlpA disulfide reductase family protein [Croceibacterium atlanticum]AKH42340.1 Thiol:disulfide interchange protein TlpA [Croceibacterium atlanticum]
MPRSLSLLLTCACALSLAACDRESAQPAQPQESAASPAGDVLTGTIDRSFAGETIPAVTVTDPAGTTLALDQTGGKAVLLNLWATWCAPCIEEMPLLDELAGDLGEDVRVLTVSEDLKGAEAVEPFFEQRGFANLPRWMDPDNDLAIEFGGGAVLPLTVLYDAQGKEIWRVVGAYDWSGEEARAEIEAALAGAG